MLSSEIVQRVLAFRRNKTWGTTWFRFLVSGTLLIFASSSGQAQDATPPLAAERVDERTDAKQEEHKRILGILPNFNSISTQNPAPLTPKHKFTLAARTAFDPFAFAIAGLTAGLSQAQNSYPGYGQGGVGYGKRFGAAYADSFDGTIIGNGVLPILFHQDPRYFRKGTGGFWKRTLYAAASTVRARSDSGHWVPNYGNVLGNLAAGGIANLYYPDADRGAGLTFQRAFTVTAQGVIGSLLVEFWPDIAQRRRHKQPAVAVP